jgi:hypothetical protein
MPYRMLISVSNIGSMHVRIEAFNTRLAKSLGSSQQAPSKVTGIWWVKVSTRYSNSNFVYDSAGRQDQKPIEHCLYMLVALKNEVIRPVRMQHDRQVTVILRWNWKSIVELHKYDAQVIVR